MAESKELKPKSFRIDDETAEKFKKIAASIGGNQQEALAKLIEAFEFQSGKAVLTEKKADIEQFERYVSAITRMFMGSLEDCQHLRETVRTEFDALLTSKDATIQSLQEELATAKRQGDEAASRASECEKENQKLQSGMERISRDYQSKLQDMQAMLTDKESLNKALTSSCNDLKARADSMESQVKESSMLKEELEELKRSHHALKKEKEDLQKQMLLEQSSHQKDIEALKQHESSALERLKEESQIELEKKLLEGQRSFQNQIQELKAEKQEEVDRYQQKYLSLLEQLQEVQNSRKQKEQEKHA